MTERQEQLLTLVIEQYIVTAEPVGSKFLAEQEGLGVSGATVRNDLHDLEEEGFLSHPHTSAGRIPTDRGYSLYVGELMKVNTLRKAEKDQFEDIIQSFDSTAQAMKQVAKQVAELVNNAVIIGFGSESVYYTGISNLFGQPELKDYVQSINMSVMFDQCEEKMPILYARIQDESTVLIGKENPLGAYCSTIMTRLGDDSLMALVGPTRMDYAKNVGVMRYVHSLFV